MGCRYRGMAAATQRSRFNCFAMLRVVGLLALALLVVAKPKAGNSPQELSDIADRLKDAKDDPEKAKQALNMMDPDSLGDSMANMMVMAMDKDTDGILTKEEINSIPMPEDDGTKGNFEEMFNNMDADGDGIEQKQRPTLPNLVTPSRAWAA
eukprot:g19362.t1